MILQCDSPSFKGPCRAVYPVRSGQLIFTWFRIFGVIYTRHVTILIQLNEFTLAAMITKGAIIISFKIIRVIETGGAQDKCGILSTTTWYFIADFFLPGLRIISHASVVDKNGDVVRRKGQCWFSLWNSGCSLQ